MNRIVRRYGLWSGIIALWVAFIALAWVLAFHGRFGMIDFAAYYEGAQRLVSGEPLYRGFMGNTYIYPPLLAQSLIPMTLVSQEAASVVWFVLNIALLIVIVAILDRRSRWRPYWWIITPLFFPVIEAITVGQVTIVMLALAVGAWAAANEGRKSLCGSLLAVMVWLKIYPALLIVYFLWKREWRVVRAAVIAGIALFLLQAAISGVGVFAEMVNVLSSLTQLGQPDLVSNNASVLGFVSQLFDASEHVQPLIVNPTLLLFTRIILSVILLGGAAYLTSKQTNFDLEYGLILLTALLLSPTLFVAGMPLLLLVYALVLRAKPSKGMLWCVTIACITLSLYWLVVIGYSGDAPVSGLLLSFGFYTLFATWCVIAYWLSKYSTIPTEIQFAQKFEG